MTHNIMEALVLGASDLVAHSRIMNGIKRRKLMIVDDLRFVRIFFMGFISLINKACSLTIPIAVSTNVHRTKPNHLCFACRLFSLQRSLNVCFMDSPNCDLKFSG